MASVEIKHYPHKVGVNVHHLEWCTKYRYRMFRQGKHTLLCEEVLRSIAKRHNMTIREMSVMPEHVHMSVEFPPSISQSKALQLLKGGSSYLLNKAQPKFRLRYPQGHFWSPGAFAASVGYNTVEVVDNYVKNQEGVHQTKLLAFHGGSPAL